MIPYVVKTNRTLKSKKALLISIAEATVASFKLEGITLSFEEAYKLAVNAANKNAKSKAI
ncbi:hypothetical protein [Crocinitomix catalasitica]|uniref:hypothetical protein n=1 Tax=Crocinitomix catalasitica TaxID=184607 RepID=UPI00048997DC|nr:hypothetical protein [Crocinitomix catalasitica]